VSFGEGSCLLRNLASDRGDPRNGAIDQLRLARPVLHMTRLPGGLRGSALIVSAFWKEVFTVIVLQSAALIPNARRYPAAWSSACTGSGRGWGFSGVFVSLRFKNCWYASPSAKLRPVAVWTRESNWKEINQRGYFFSRKYMPLGDPSKDLPIPTQLDWRKQYQDAG